MAPLLYLLLKERWRQSGRLYGWPGRLTIMVLMLVVALGATALVGRLLDAASAEQVGIALNKLVGLWIVPGVLIGKDLTWHTRLDKITFFPLSFDRLYLLTLLLGLLSFPLLLLLCCLEVSFTGRGVPRIGWLATLVGFLLIVCCVRATVSVVRTTIFKRYALRNNVQKLLWTVIACAAVLIAVSALDGRLAHLLPGYQLALVLLGVNPVLHLAIVAAQAALLVAGDFLLQREVVYSGITGPPATRMSTWSRGRFLLFKSSPKAALWRLSLLGWMRTPRVALLVTGAAVYSFAYIWFVRLEGQATFILYSCMAWAVHASIRGNLLGIDHKSAWFYFMLPIPIEDTIRAKNSSLTFLQMIVVAAVLLPPLLRNTTGMTTPLEWMAVLSYAYSTIMIGEIVGSFFSVLRPYPLERTSLYSGGTTLAAFVLPGCQCLFLAIFVACNFQLPPVIAVILLAGVPAVLLLVRSAVLRSWVHREMTRQRDRILFKLSRTTT